MEKFIWWLEPGRVAGMMMPWLAPERRLAGNAALDEFDDELQQLHNLGVCSVVSLLNIKSDQSVYESAGFHFFCSPIKDFGAPTIEQMHELCDFIDTAPGAVAVHCEGGLGRTGTVLAGWLIRNGADPEEAIARVREAEPGAIESNAQINFICRFHESLN